MAARNGQNRLIVVPVFNEAPSVAKVLRAIQDASPGSDVLVIDDGSTDGTNAIVDEWVAGHARVTALTHERNAGYGQTLIDGFAYAAAKGYEFVLTIDCDEQHEPKLIPRFFEAVDSTDIVSGSRYLVEDRREAPAPADRRAINETVTAWIRARTGYDITDAFCGFKAYKVAALRRLALTETGYGMPLQLWLQAAAARLHVRELAVPLIYKSNFERHFGGGLDDSSVRLAYYRSVLAREDERLASADERSAREDERLTPEAPPPEACCVSEEGVR